MSGMRPTLRETRSQDVNLNALVDGIDTGQVVLPDFQRDFDWGAGDIRALLGTVLNGWPMGSLLLIEGSANEEFYAPRAVDLAPPIADEVVYTILDGQQRLTSMYHALTGKGETIFALKLSAKIDYDDVDSLDEAIISFPRGAWPEAQARMRESGIGFCLFRASEMRRHSSNGEMGKIYLPIFRLGLQRLIEVTCRGSTPIAFLRLL